MTYRDILRNQLLRRQEMNPKYSLRAFATKLGLSPSKLSEILSGKKHLSVERALIITEKINLSNKEKEFFLTSVKIESPREKLNKDEHKLHLQNLQKQFLTKKTTQKNAWYFSAINALDENGIDSEKYKSSLRLTDLQIENAKRYINRIKRFYPERQEFSLEPISIIKKIEDEIYTNATDIESEFLFLTEKQLEDLKLKIRSLVRTTKLKAKSKDPSELIMTYWGFLNILKK